MPRPELLRRLDEIADRYEAEAAERESPAHDDCGPTLTTMHRSVAAVFRGYADALRAGNAAR